MKKALLLVLVFTINTISKAQPNFQIITSEADSSQARRRFKRST